MTYQDLPNFIVSIWGAFVGFLYLISSNSDTVEERRNFMDTFYKALQGFCAALAISGAVVETIIYMRFFDESFFTVYIRAAISFLVCVKHKTFIAYLVKKFTKTKN